MRGKKRVLGFFFLGLLSISVISAKNNSEVEIGFSGDFVSSYVWRGFKQAGASIQPSLSAEYKGFSVGAWASTDIAGNDKKEVDFSLGYSTKGLTIGVTDYWWDGEMGKRYFSYPTSDNMGHMLEGNISYSFSGSFPLTLSWNTFFMGKGNKKVDGSNSYSTYIEALYPFSVNNVDMFLSSGFIPWKSTVYGAGMDGFKFVSVQFGVSKTLKINEKFSFPLFANVIINPAVEDIHFVFGITIR